MTPWRRLWGAAVVVLLVAGLSADAWAHAKLVRSAPGDGATLAEAPQEVRLWFDEDIAPAFSSARLLDASGRPVELAGVRTHPSDRKLLIVPVPALAAGIYSLLASTLSEADGHVSRTFLVFGVGEVGDLSASVRTETETFPPFVEVALRWANFTLLSALIGAIVVLYLILRPVRATLGAEPPAAAALGLVERRILAWACGCAVATWLVGVGLLLVQAMTVAATPAEARSFPSVMWQVLGQTRGGAFWVARQGLLLALIGALSRARLAPAAVLLLPALIVVQALTGHTAAVTPHLALAVVNDGLHLLAAGVWIGGLLALGVGLWPLFRGDRSAVTAVAYAGWRRFSWLAAVSLGLLVATGLYNMSRQVASVDGLIGTVYGQALLVKIGLTLAVGACGLLNAMLLHPVVAAPLAWLLRRPRGWTPCSLARLPALVVTEAGLALLVLLAASVVTAAPPPRGPEFTVVPDDVPKALTQVVGDVVVTLSVKPNRPGQNVFTVFTASTRRPAPADIMRVIVRFSRQEIGGGPVSVIAQAVDRGRFQVGGSHLSLAGPWRVEVVIRRKGIADAVAGFDWVVAPPGSSRPVVLSKAPLASSLTFAAAGTLGAVLLVAGVACLAMGKEASRTRLGDLPEAAWGDPAEGTGKPT